MYIKELFKTKKIHHSICLVGDYSNYNKVVDKIILYLNIDKHEIWNETEVDLTIAIVRKAVAWINQKPLVGKNKLVLINLDDLSVQSSNVLLKSLEEPPKYIIFLLRSSKVENILPTIKSRCHIYYLDKSVDLIQQKSENELDGFVNLISNQTQAEVESKLLTWLTKYRGELRQGGKVDLVKKILNILKYTKTNTNKRLLLEYTYLLMVKDNHNDF